MSFERVETKLAEAKFFTDRIAGAGPNVFEASCYLSAFASAARSVTFALQAVLRAAPGFDEWYAGEVERLRADQAARWFVLLRNATQKEGAFGIVGGTMRSRPDGSLEIKHTAQVGTDDVVEDVVEAGRRQLATLESLVERARTAFARWADPLWLFDEANLVESGLSIDELEEMLGFPRGWTDIGIPISERLRLLSRYA